MTSVDYLKEFWCAFCGRKVKHGAEKLSEKGQPRCRKCGKLLRVNAHNKGKRKEYLTLITDLKESVRL